MKHLLSLLLVLTMVAALPLIGVAEGSESIYPLDTDVTLRYWSTSNEPYTGYSSYLGRLRAASARGGFVQRYRQGAELFRARGRRVAADSL